VQVTRGLFPSDVNSDSSRDTGHLYSAFYMKISLACCSTMKFDSANSNCSNGQENAF
jgi:hypothetical protein